MIKILRKIAHSTVRALGNMVIGKPNPELAGRMNCPRMRNNLHKMQWNIAQCEAHADYNGTSFYPAVIDGAKAYVKRQEETNPGWPALVAEWEAASGNYGSKARTSAPTKVHHKHRHNSSVANNIHTVGISESAYDTHESSSSSSHGSGDD